MTNRVRARRQTHQLISPLIIGKRRRLIVIGVSVCIQIQIDRPSRKWWLARITNPVLVFIVPDAAVDFAGGDQLYRQVVAVTAFVGDRETLVAQGNDRPLGQSFQRAADRRIAGVFNENHLFNSRLAGQ